MYWPCEHPAHLPLQGRDLPRSATAGTATSGQHWGVRTNWLVGDKPASKQLPKNLLKASFPQIISTMFLLPQNCACVLEKMETISEKLPASHVSTLLCLSKEPSITSWTIPFHHTLRHHKSESSSTCPAVCPLQEGSYPTSQEGCHWEFYQKLHSTCSVLCSGHPPLQSFSMRGRSSGLFFFFLLKESGPSHPCCSFNDVNELQQGWNWAIIFYVHMSRAH